MSDISKQSHIINLIFGITFIIIGTLNIILVHVVPGLFYLFLTLVYVPQVDDLIEKQVGVRIPIQAKIVLGLIVLWGTLAVGDLAEILGL